jgi:Uma2 family endonuclease
MTVANVAVPLPAEHMVLDSVSWEFYEHFLNETNELHYYTTFDRGRMEIMSPLPQHEIWGGWIGRLIELICLDRSIPVRSFESTTFRSKPKRRGLEPDQCFYIQNYEASLEIFEKFDASIHAAPDLAVEIDITNRSIDREPVYAALKIAELWRFDGEHLQTFHLSANGKYVQRTRSLALPFLPMDGFETFVLRMRERNQLAVLNEFRQWVNQLSK